MTLPSSAVSNDQPYAAGYTYLNASASPANGSNFQSNIVRFGLPFTVKRAITISQLGIFVTTVSAGGNYQAAIVRRGTDGLPGVVVATTGNISAASAGWVSATPTGGNATLAPGDYVVATNCDNNSSAILSAGASTAGMAQIGSKTPATFISTGNMVSQRQVTRTFNDWSTFVGATFGERPDQENGPLVGFTVASVS